jgi:hypothetical protein
MDPLYNVSMETTPRAAELMRQREVLLARLHALPGSVYERPRKCGRATCACAGGGPKHRTRQLTVTLDGKTHTRYVRRGEVETVGAWIATYQELWALVEALTAVNLELLRGAHPGGARGRGRGRRKGRA